MTSDHILVNGLVTEAFIGITHEERQSPTRIQIDIDITTSLEKAAKHDNLDYTIDYAAIRDDALEIVKNSKHNLLETLANEIIIKIKNKFSSNQVEVTIRKLNLFNDTKAVGIKMKR